MAFSSGGTITTSTTTTYSYAGTNYANPHAVTQITPATSTQATTTYTYDNNGNLTQSGTVNGTTTYAWDYRNRMTGSATSTVSGTTTYLYDHADQRVRKSDKSATTTYIGKFYDTTSSTATTSASTTAYIWVGDTVVATVEANGYATSTYFVHPDHLGSANVITNSAGAVTQVVDYYPFGEERLNTKADLADRTFIDQFYDREQSLSYLNARYYQGSRGQFLSQDPVFWSPEQNLSDPQSLNSYSYAQNNPINAKDPEGKEALTLTAVAIILVSLAAILTSISALQMSGHSSSSLQPVISGVGNVLNTLGTAIKTGTVVAVSTVVMNSAGINVIPPISGVGGTAVTTPYAITPRGIGVPAVRNIDIPGIYLSKGKTTITEKSGGYPQAKKDFDALNPTNVTPQPNGTITGKLTNGEKVNVRPHSTDGRPTLEIQKPNGDIQKTRYNE